MTSLALTPWPGLALRGPLRPYQRMALDAFESDRRAGLSSMSPPTSQIACAPARERSRIGEPDAGEDVPAGRDELASAAADEASYVTSRRTLCR